MRETYPYGHAFRQIVYGNGQHKQPYPVAAFVAGAAGPRLMVFVGRELIKPKHQHDAQCYAQHHQRNARHRTAGDVVRCSQAGNQQRKHRCGQHHAGGNAQHDIFGALMQLPDAKRRQCPQRGGNEACRSAGQRQTYERLLGSH